MCLHVRKHHSPSTSNCVGSSVGSRVAFLYLVFCASSSRKLTRTLPRSTRAASSFAHHLTLRYVHTPDDGSSRCLSRFPSQSNGARSRGPNGDSSTTASNGSPVSDSRDIFSFLSLPAGLRANILRLVAEEQDAYIIANGPRHPLAFHSLEAVNRQVRSEFVASLYLSSGEFISKVTNFDFEHVAAFLDHLSDAEIAHLAEVTRSGVRKLSIEITLTEYPSTHAAYLHTWIERFGGSTGSKGSDISFAYRIIDSMPSSRHFIKGKAIGDPGMLWVDYVRKQRKEFVEKGPRTVQCEKLKSVLIWFWTLQLWLRLKGEVDTKSWWLGSCG